MAEATPNLMSPILPSTKIFEVSIQNGGPDRTFPTLGIRFDLASYLSTYL
jgi:hypothetical protein